MLTESQFHRIFRASAWYDLALSSPFAVAPGVALIWWLFNALHAFVGLPPMAPLEPHGMMFANFFGTVVTIWALVRLRLDLPILARYDAGGRALFALAMAVALANGASPMLWGFLVAEASWAVAQLLPVRPYTRGA